MSKKTGPKKETIVLHAGHRKDSATNAVAVEILNVPSPSPPIPAVSIDPLGVTIFKDFSKISKKCRF